MGVKETVASTFAACGTPPASVFAACGVPPASTFTPQAAPASTWAELGGVGAPVITDIIGEELQAGTSVASVIRGRNFLAGATLNFSGAGLSATGVTIVDAFTITCTLVATLAATPGTRTLSVTTTSGTSNTLPITILAATYPPPPISGYGLWLDARQLGLADLASVSTWPDLSGNGRDFTVRAGGFTAPTYRSAIMNARPGVRFNGGTDQLEASATPFLAGPQTLLVVYKWSSVPPANNNGLFAWSKGSTGYSYGWRAAGFNYAPLWLNGSLFPSGGDSLRLAPVLVGVVARAVAVASVGHRHFINGSEISAANVILTPLNATKVALGVAFSEQATTGAAIPGPADIAELLWYPRELSTAEMLSMFTDYFQPGWGL